LRKEESVAVSFVIYAALGLLGLATGLAILIFSNFGIIKEKEGALLSNAQAAWFLWVAGVAELIASVYFAAQADFLDAVTFGGYGLFWVALGTMTYWKGDARVLGPISIAYAVFSLPLMFRLCNRKLDAILSGTNALLNLPRSNSSSVGEGERETPWHFAINMSHIHSALHNRPRICSGPRITRLCVVVPLATTYLKIAPFFFNFTILTCKAKNVSSFNLAKESTSEEVGGAFYPL